MPKGAALGQINYTKCRRWARSVGHFMANLICIQKIEQKANGLNLMGVARRQAEGSKRGYLVTQVPAIESSLSASANGQLNCILPLVKHTQRAPLISFNLHFHWLNLAINASLINICEK